MRSGSLRISILSLRAIGLMLSVLFLKIGSAWPRSWVEMLLSRVMLLGFGFPVAAALHALPTVRRPGDLGE
jgi:hypothetical protein